MNIEERLAALEAKMQELTDRQAIFDCIKRNSRGNDRFDAELTASTYHVDGLHEVGPNRVPGPGYGAHANEAHGKLFEANLHNVTMHMCEIKGDVAHAESYSLGMFVDKGGETGRVLAGRYIDRLERREGEWRIVLRRSTVEVALQGKAILPTGATLPGSGYLRGNRERTVLLTSVSSLPKQEVAGKRCRTPDKAVIQYSELDCLNRSFVQQSRAIYKRPV